MLLDEHCLLRSVEGKCVTYVIGPEMLQIICLLLVSLAFQEFAGDRGA